MKAGPASTNQTETIVLVGGLALVAYFLKDAFRGFGEGIGGIGKGLAAIGSGIGQGIDDITGVIPWAEKEADKAVDFWGSQVHGFEQDVNYFAGGLGDVVDYWIGGTADNIKGAAHGVERFLGWVNPWD